MKRADGHRFIVLEGISGSGKTELCKLLAQQISAQYYTTPPKMFCPSRKEVDAKACLQSRFLFYLASVVQASHEINEILKSQSVVCDKYILSTICYHIAHGLDVKIPQGIICIQPDYTFLIACDNGVRLRRLRSSRGPVMDKEKYELRQQMERRCMIEFQKRIDQEIDNTADGPQHAVDRILTIIRG